MVIEKRLSDEYNIQDEINLFRPIQEIEGLQTGPLFEGDDERDFSTPKFLQGMYLTPFADEDGNPFCPVQLHYNSSSPFAENFKGIRHGGYGRTLSRPVISSVFE